MQLIFTEYFFSPPLDSNINRTLSHGNVEKPLAVDYLPERRNSRLVERLKSGIMRLWNFILSVEYPECLRQGHVFTVFRYEGATYRYCLHCGKIESSGQDDEQPYGVQIPVTNH